MAGFFEGLFNRGSTPALAATLSFTHARHQVIAENIANMSTPGYKARRLDLDAFQRALGSAMERRGNDPRAPFVIERTDQFHTDDAGRLVTEPATRPGRNAVFHDGTNLSLEREMADLAQNAMLNEITVELMRGKIDGMRKAIRGRA